MALSRLRDRAVLRAVGLTLGVIPLTLALPASAASEQWTNLTIGPVPVPAASVTACAGTDCVSTPALQAVALSATASVTSGSLNLISLNPAACPNGGKGVAIGVTSLQPVTVTLSATMYGTTTAGSPYNLQIGPVTAVVNPGTPNVLVSACTG